MDIRPRLVYFDNNAIGNLFQVRQGRSTDLLSVWRTRLVHRVRIGAVIVAVSLYGLEEFGPVLQNDPNRYMATLDFLQWQARAPLIAPTETLLSREMDRGRRLRTGEIGLDLGVSDRVWALARNGRALAEIAPQTQSKKERYAVTMKGLLAEMGDNLRRLRLPKYRGRPVTVHRLAWSWAREDMQRMIDGLATKALQRVLEREKPKRPSGVSLAMVPSLRNYAAFHLGRTVRNSLGKKIKPSDAHDHDHYVAASYTDLLVTDDAEFRETVGLLDSPFRTRTFDAFFQDPCGPIISFPDA